MRISLRNIVGSICMLICAPLYGQQFVPGKIIVSKSDTIFCHIVKIEKSKADATLNFREVRVLDSLNHITSYFPGEIEGYIKEGVVYKSLVFDDEQIFIRQIVEGNASLFFYSDLQKSEYIFKRQHENYYNILNIPDQTIRRQHGNNGDMLAYTGGLANIYIIEKNVSFLNFFTEYFKDCASLVYKIKSEFYTSSDMKDIFKDYNQHCGKK